MIENIREHTCKAWKLLSRIGNALSNGSKCILLQQITLYINPK